MYAPPPSPQNAMTLIGSCLMRPLRMSALSPAAVPTAAEPEAPSCVCIQGTTQEVEEYVVLGTDVHPGEPRMTVAGPAALAISFITRADSHPWHVLCPEVKYSSRAIFLTPLKGSRFWVGIMLHVFALVITPLRQSSSWVARPCRSWRS